MTSPTPTGPSPAAMAKILGMLRTLKANIAKAHLTANELELLRRDISDLEVKLNEVANPYGSAPAKAEVSQMTKNEIQAAVRREIPAAFAKLRARVLNS